MVKFGNSAALTRTYNRAVILDALRRTESLSRVELARLSGLTPQAVRNIVEDLLAEGFVKQIGRRKGLRGQPQIEVAINPDRGYSLGFHVTGSECRYLGTNLVGDVVFEGGAFKLASDAAEIRRSLEQIEAACSQSMQDRARLGVGIAVSAPLAMPRHREPHSDYLEQVRTIQHFFGPDTWIENDANAAAMAENLSGTAKERSDFLYIFIGAGVGGAIVRDSKLQRGYRGNAGEFGHILVDPNGPQCHCGNRGCLHTYLSLAEFGDRIDRLGSDDGEIKAWLARAVPPLTRAIVTLENAFDPDRIILGGTAPGWLLELLLTGVQEILPSTCTDEAHQRVEISRLGTTSALLGASALPLLNLMTPHPDLLTKQSLEGMR